MSGEDWRRSVDERTDAQQLVADDPELRIERVRGAQVELLRSMHESLLPVRYSDDFYRELAQEPARQVSAPIRC